MQDFLDLPGEDVIAGNNQHFLLSATDVQVAVFIQLAYITRIQPAVAQGLGRFLRTLAVAAHDLGTGYPDFAFLPCFQYLCAGLGIHYLYLRCRQGDAYRGGFLHPVHRVERDHRAGLGLAVAFQYRRAGNLFPLIQNLARQGRGAGRRQVQVGKIGVGKARVIQQPGKNGRAAAEQGDLLPGQRGKHLSGMITRQDNQGAATVNHGMKTHGHRIAMKQGHDAQHSFHVLPGGEQGLALAHVNGKGIMADTRALGPAGGAAGELQGGRVIGLW